MTDVFREELLAQLSELNVRALDTVVRDKSLKFLQSAAAIVRMRKSQEGLTKILTASVLSSSYELALEALKTARCPIVAMRAWNALIAMKPAAIGDVLLAGLSSRYAKQIHAEAWARILAHTKNHESHSWYLEKCCRVMMTHLRKGEPWTANALETATRTQCVSVLAAFSEGEHSLELGQRLWTVLKEKSPSLDDQARVLGAVVWIRRAMYRQHRDRTFFNRLSDEASVLLHASARTADIPEITKALGPMSGAPCRILAHELLHRQDRVGVRFVYDTRSVPLGLRQRAARFLGIAVPRLPTSRRAS